MQFRTDLQLQPYPRQLSPQDKILSLGSCFASHMGEQLTAHKFDISVNPGGILFNPVSIARLLRMALGEETPGAFQQADHVPVWHHFGLHSDMSRATRAEAEAGLRQLLESLRNRLEELDVLILTLGTARVYTLEGEVVANCHKYPGDRFQRRLLSVEEMHQYWQPLLETLRQKRPDLQVLLTVSPVRHTRDGLSENGISKALLRVFCEEWAQQDEAVQYFPAYEMMLDDLRDYRFYKADMIHPNETAQTYIWELFQKTMMDEAARMQVTNWAQIRRDLNHQPRYPGSEGHIRFLASIQQKLMDQPAHIDTARELQQIRQAMQA
ncbi:MAG: GSCFA domain-containing protein, partial [Bacteroidota bacterium]